MAAKELRSKTDACTSAEDTIDYFDASLQSVPVDFAASLADVVTQCCSLAPSYLSSTPWSIRRAFPLVFSALLTFDPPEDAKRRIEISDRSLQLFKDSSRTTDVDAMLGSLAHTSGVDTLRAQVQKMAEREANLQAILTAASCTTPKQETTESVMKTAFVMTGVPNGGSDEAALKRLDHLVAQGRRMARAFASSPTFSSVLIPHR